MSDEREPLRLADLRSLALHSSVASRLLTNDEVIHRALSRVQKWLQEPQAHPYAAAWQELLTQPPEVVAKALVEPSETMATLRQASPFAGAIDVRTRWEILKRTELRPREAR